MHWVTIIWSMIASACLTLAAIHFLVWCCRRTAWDDLLFTLTSTAVAAYAVIELWMMRSETSEEFATALRWIHVPTWVFVLSLVGFVRLHLRAGRPWLAWAVCALRTLALVLNFLVGQNLSYREVTNLRHIPILGESVSIGVGVLNPCMLVGQLCLLLLLIFTTDATITVWRRGDRRQALITGGSIVFFSLAAIAQAVLVLWQIVDWPLTASFFSLGIVVAMGYDMSRVTLRAGELADELRDGEARMTLAAAAANLGIWSRDLTRDEIWASENWRRLFGFTKSERLDLDRIFQRVHVDDRETVREAFDRAITRDGHYSMDFRVVLTDGHVRWIASRGQVQFTSGGKPVLVRGASMDISDRKQAEQELAQQRNELAHLSRVTSVSELSGSLAHELNQPLGIILSNAQAAQELLAQEPPVLAEVNEILADIVAEDRRAAEIIERLRALLKPGEMTLQTLSLNDLLDEVLRLVRADLIGRGVTVTCNLTPDLPPVNGDRVQLQQLALNLILNAADSMAVNVPGTRLLHLTTSRRQSIVRASVRDEGVGLPANIERLFQPFFTTKAQGMGLGLGICRSIITAHHGRVWAEPHPERGAIFHFELPVAGGEDNL